MYQSGTHNMVSHCHAGSGAVHHRVHAGSLSGGQDLFFANQVKATMVTTSPACTAGRRAAQARRWSPPQRPGSCRAAPTSLPPAVGWCRAAALGRPPRVFPVQDSRRSRRSSGACKQIASQAGRAGSEAWNWQYCSSTGQIETAGVPARLIAFPGHPCSWHRAQGQKRCCECTASGVRWRPGLRIEHRAVAQRQHIVHGEVAAGAAAQQDLPRRVQVNRSDRPVMMTRTWAPAHTDVCWTRIAMHASSLSEDHGSMERKLTSFGCDLHQEHSKGFLCKRTCMARGPLTSSIRVTTLHLPSSLRV